MPVLAINNVPLPVKEEDLKTQFEQVGESGRAASGTWRNHRRYQKRVWEFSLKHQTITDARAWAALLRGEHHVFSFDSNVYSSKGQPPIAGHSATIISTAPKYGANCLNVPSATSISWLIGVGGGDVNNPLSYAVAVWREESAVWKHYLVNSNGQKWENGVRNDAASTSFIVVSPAGTVALSGNVGLTKFDDLVVWPTPLPTTWPPLIYSMAKAYPRAPRLEAYGDLIPGSTITNCLYVQGDAEGMTHGRAKFSGTLDRVAATVQGTIREE